MANRGHSRAWDILNHPQFPGDLQAYDWGFTGIDRHDPILLLALEELGSAMCSGPSSELAILELHGNFYKVINLDDGSEVVIEPPGDSEWVTI